MNTINHQNTNQHTSSYLQSYQRSVPYCSDLTSVFASLCDNKQNTLLLESADIDSRNSLNSLLFLNTALKIECTDQTVTFIVLNDNAKPLLASVEQSLINKQQQAYQSLSFELPTLAFDHVDDNHLSVTFPVLDSDLDEDSKLQALTVFDGLRVLQELFAEQQAEVFLGGLFTYDVVAGFIPMEGIELKDDGIDCPDYSFYLPEQLLITNHQTQESILHSFCFNAEYDQELVSQADAISERLHQPLTLPQSEIADTTVSVSYDDKSFIDIIEQLRHHIYQGDVFQIVPSRRFSLACPSSLSAYYQLKQNNPSPYMFYMQDDRFILFGASPESSLKYTKESNQLELYPIAGSRPRGFDEHGNIDMELDARLELDMRLDKKELAEHLMLVDLARNDIARVCNTGTRTVDKLMQVDRYSHIMHLVSRVVGKLKPSLDALHAYQACMNMGTLTGAPKIKAMQLIYKLEQQKRHNYGGAVGYLTSKGDFDTCIVIRSAIVQNGVAYVQAGCGQVLDSDAQAEADETRHKARAVIKAIGQVHGNAHNFEHKDIIPTTQPQQGV